jgi:uncharacterized protein
MRRLLIGIVKAYQLLVSPALGSACRFEPTCSRYAVEALKVHGSLRGGALSAWRILRCGPWCAGGHDAVPGSEASILISPALFTSLIEPKAVSQPEAHRTLPPKAS